MRNAPFASLSYRGQVPRLRGLAAAALAQYGLEGARIALLAHRGNTLFRVDAPGGRRWVLRVYGPDHPDPAPIRSELLWLAALARETDLGVPAPLPAATGRC